MVATLDEEVESRLNLSIREVHRPNPRIQEPSAERIPSTVVNDNPNSFRGGCPCFSVVWAADQSAMHRVTLDPLHSGFLARAGTAI